MTEPGTQSASNDEYPPTGYAWYVVVILTIAYVFSFLDRQILSLLVEPIKADLGISDTQMSLLQGLAFGIFYTLLGIPIGRLADRRSRRAIIAAGTTIWCLMTAACGLAKNFPQLFLARIGIGIGEAALNPSAFSLISDYFPREKRARPMSFYNMGVSLGAGIAMVLGGQIIAWAFGRPPLVVPLVGELFQWQTVFLVVGLPGLLVAVMMITVKEPSRKDRIALSSGSHADDHLTIRAVANFLWERKSTYGTLFLGMSVVTIIGYGYFSWIPTMFMRTWNWEISEIAFAYGVIILIFGPLGVNFGGWLAERWYRKGRRAAHMRVTLLGVCILAGTPDAHTRAGRPHARARHNRRCHSNCNCWRSVDDDRTQSDARPDDGHLLLRYQCAGSDAGTTAYSGRNRQRICRRISAAIFDRYCFRGRRHYGDGLPGCEYSSLQSQRHRSRCLERRE